MNTSPNYTERPNSMRKSVAYASTTGFVDWDGYSMVTGHVSGIGLTASKGGTLCIHRHHNQLHSYHAPLRRHNHPPHARRTGPGGRHVVPHRQLLQEARGGRVRQEQNHPQEPQPPLPGRPAAHPVAWQHRVAACSVVFRAVCAAGYVLKFGRVNLGYHGVAGVSGKSDGWMCCHGWVAAGGWHGMRCHGWVAELLLGRGRREVCLVCDERQEGLRHCGRGTCLQDWSIDFDKAVGHGARKTVT